MTLDNGTRYNATYHKIIEVFNQSEPVVQENLARNVTWNPCASEISGALDTSTQFYSHDSDVLQKPHRPDVIQPLAKKGTWLVESSDNPLEITTKSPHPPAIGNMSSNFYIEDVPLLHAAGAKFFANGTGLGVNTTFINEYLTETQQQQIDNAVNLHFVEYGFPFGSLVMNGPYFKEKICYLGSNCTVHLEGVGLRENGFLYISNVPDKCSIPTNITSNLTYQRTMNALNEDRLN